MKLAGKVIPTDAPSNRATSAAKATRAIQLLDRFNWLGALANDGASGGELRVGFAIAAHCNGTSGRCDPALDTIAAEAKMDRPHACREIRKLTRRGFLQILPGGRTNQYALLVPAVPSRAHVPSQARQAVPSRAPKPVIPTRPSLSVSKDTSRERAHAPLSGAARPSGRKPKASGSPCTLDSRKAALQLYRPSCETLLYLKQKRPDLAAHQIQATLEKFKNYLDAKPPAADTIDGRFRNWCLEERLPKKRKPQKHRKRWPGYDPRFDDRVASDAMPHGGEQSDGEFTPKELERWRREEELERSEETAADDAAADRHNRAYRARRDKARDAS